MTLDMEKFMALKWHLTKEEIKAEINDFLYGIEVIEGRNELTDQEIKHLLDLYELLDDEETR